LLGGFGQRATIFQCPSATSRRSVSGRR
jgi:hypothetical protein